MVICLVYFPFLLCKSIYCLFVYGTVELCYVVVRTLILLTLIDLQTL